jgi:hypothetical protein
LCLKENYGALFDSVALKSELLVMFSDTGMFLATDPEGKVAAPV